MIIHALIRCNTLNHEEIGKNLQRISKIKHIIKNVIGKQQTIHQEEITRKSLKKIIQKLLLKYFMWKK